MYENSYTLKTLPGLITTTYVSAVVMAIIFIVISIIIANMIAYEGGKNPRDAFRRKVWFWILAVFNAIMFFVWNLIYVSDKVVGKPAKSEFLIHNAVATGVTLVAFIVIGILLSKLMKKGKYGTIFS
jgi:Mn2+/Fe2+ NRAMP family transporter